MKKFNKKIKKILNKSFGFDWQMSEHIKIQAGQGTFTINKLVKEFNINPNELNLLIVSYPYYGNKEDYMTKIVQIKEDLKNIDLLERKIPGYNYRLSIFHTKQDFEAIRRCKENCYWLISIKPEAIQEVKKINIEHEIMYNQNEKNSRFVVDGKAYIKYALNYNCIDIMKDGKKYDLNISTMYGRLKINAQDADGGLKHFVLKDLLDKSGYPVYQYREALKAKCAKNKINRLKFAIEAGQLDRQNNILYDLIFEAKNIFADKIKNATTFSEIRKIKSLDKIEAMMVKYEAHLLMQKCSLDDNTREWEKYMTLEEWTNGYFELKKDFIEVVTALKEA